MPADPNNLLWVDMEMSGLNPDNDKVLEVAIVVTDTNLNTVAEAPVLVVHQSDAVLDAMDTWNKGTHGKSGLIERAVAKAIADGKLKGNEAFPARMQLTIGKIGLNLTLDGEIRLE